MGMMEKWWKKCRNHTFVSAENHNFVMVPRVETCGLTTQTTWMKAYFSMKENMLTDEEILQGFCKFDERITREHFYGICQQAYDYYDLKYQLRKKEGLDFYSLAHDYYVQLLKNGFRPLKERQQGIPLAIWMRKGFKFVVLDALKNYNKEREMQSETPLEIIGDRVMSSGSNTLLLRLSDAVDKFYHDDIMREIAYRVLYAGYSQKEVAESLGLTPSAVNQRYKRMMEEVVQPFVYEHYSHGISSMDPVCYSVKPETKGWMPERRRVDIREERAAPEMLHSAMEGNKILHSLFHTGMFDSNNGDVFDAKMAGRVTPPLVTDLKDGEVLVFGSNLCGLPTSGPALMAVEKFGARPGQSMGLMGQSYALPTMVGDLCRIWHFVDRFLDFASRHSSTRFLVTPLGCGVEGYTPSEIALLFRRAVDMKNISLPKEFWEVLKEIY